VPPLCVTLSTAEFSVSPVPVPVPVPEVAALRSAASGDGVIASVLLGAGVAAAVTVSVAVSEPDDGLEGVASASVAPLDPLPVESPLPELVLDTAASVALVPDEVAVLGAGSDVGEEVGAGSDAVGVLGAGSDVGDGAGVGSGDGAGALGAGSVVALPGGVVGAGAVASVTGAVAVCVVVATVSLVVATGSEAVVVFVADPVSAAVPLTSLMTSPSRLVQRGSPLLLSGYPSGVGDSTQRNARSFSGVI
jgi:hypothetical protein